MHPLPDRHAIAGDLAVGLVPGGDDDGSGARDRGSFRGDAGIEPFAGELLCPLVDAERVRRVDEGMPNRTGRRARRPRHRRNGDG
ncbi:hypothetical protein AB5I41_07140 [Sphingomonas sp. MMS24-JH45]